MILRDPRTGHYAECDGCGRVSFRVLAASRDVLCELLRVSGWIVRTDGVVRCPRCQQSVH